MRNRVIHLEPRRSVFYTLNSVFNHVKFLSEKKLFELHAKWHDEFEWTEILKLNVIEMQLFVFNCFCDDILRIFYCIATLINTLRYSISSNNQPDHCNALFLTNMKELNK